MPHLLRKSLAVALLAAALSLGPGAASWASTSDVCSAASDLIDHDSPDLALSLITDYRAGATAALNAGITTTSALTAQATACPTEFAAALLAQNTGSLAPNAWELIGTSWDTFVTRHLVPLGSAAIAVTALVVLGLIGARVLVMFQRRPWGRRMRRAEGRAIAGAGGVLILLGSISLVLALSLDLAPLDVATPIAALILWVVGSVTIAAYLAGRLRLTIDVLDEEGKPNPTLGARVASYLGDFSAARPDEFDLPPAPEGTDVSALVPDQLLGKVAASLAAAAQSFFGLVPWKVTIAPHDVTRASVTIRRNGYTVVSTEVDITAWRGLVRPLPIGATEKDTETATVALTRYTLKASSAVVLATLAEGHDGFPLLFGATDAASIGLYYIARTEFEKDDATARDLLAQALQNDPHNTLAIIAAESVRYRKSTSVPELVAYSEGLDRQLRGPRNVGDPRKPYLQASTKGGPSPELDLRLRVLTIHGYVTRNLLAALSLQKPTAYTCEVEAAVRTGYSSVSEAITLLTNPRLEGVFYERMRLKTAITAAVLAANDNAPEEFPAINSEVARWLGRCTRSWAPDIAYSLICLLSILTNRQVPPPLATVDRAERARIAFLDPEYVKWYRDDPEMEKAKRQRWVTDAAKAALTSD
jgi:hypothetical protein